MSCGCGKKKRMARYSSQQIVQQAQGVLPDNVVASATVMSPTTGQPERSK